uniref:Uncharacterized protein n=1 Tax=Globisporangium ultimum (strain ATCC 200006 / CBS 805.95 / DAOM BR144) TaxID=431595 RepID=K3WC69_GLOUD
MMRAGLKSVVLAAAVLLVAATHAAELSYPKCVEGASGCCDFGSGKMKSPGYAVVRLDVDTIITCSHGSLQCFEGNPNLRGGLEGNTQIDCPDFLALEEGRSEIEYLDGEKITPTTTTTTTESGPGTVKAA